MASTVSLPVHILERLKTSKGGETREDGAIYTGSVTEVPASGITVLSCFDGISLAKQQLLELNRKKNRDLVFLDVKL